MFATDSATFPSHWTSELTASRITNETGPLPHRSSPDAFLFFDEKNSHCVSSVQRKITNDAPPTNEAPAGMSHEDFSPTSKCEAMCNRSSPIQKKKQTFRKEARIHIPRRREKPLPAKAFPIAPTSCGKMWIRHTLIQNNDERLLSSPKNKSIALHERTAYSPYQGIHRRKSRSHSSKSTSVATSSESSIDKAIDMAVIAPSEDKQKDTANSGLVPPLYSSHNLQRPRPTITFGESGRLLKPVRHSVCYIPNRAQQFLSKY